MLDDDDKRWVKDVITFVVQRELARALECLAGQQDHSPEIMYQSLVEQNREKDAGLES